MIEIGNLSKRYGETLADGGLDVAVKPGAGAGFPGPDGAGKPVTMWVIAGRDKPTAGRVRVNGREDGAAAAPVAGPGVLLEAQAVPAGRPARDHRPRCGARPRHRIGSLG